MTTGRSSAAIRGASSRSRAAVTPRSRCQPSDRHRAARRVELVDARAAGEMFLLIRTTPQTPSWRSAARSSSGLLAGDRDHPRSRVRIAAQGGGDQTVVGAVHADLDRYPVVEADRVEHGDIGLGGGLRGRVAAVTDEGRIRPAADDVGVGVPGSARNLEGGEPGLARRQAQCGGMKSDRERRRRASAQHPPIHRERQAGEMGTRTPSSEARKTTRLATSSGVAHAAKRDLPRHLLDPRGVGRGVDALQREGSVHRARTEHVDADPIRPEVLGEGARGHHFAAALLIE